MELHYGTVFEAIADQMGSAPALVHGTERLSWQQYDLQAARFASFIDGLGLRPDSKVALYLYNGNEYLVAQYGAFKQRCVPVNVNYRYLDHELAYLLDNSDAEVLVYHASLGEHVAARARASGRGWRSTTAADTAPAPP
jgi:3-oxocholest-4-en-26-oate---CoA ligase